MQSGGLQAVRHATQHSADFQSHLLAKLLKSAHQHNKLRQFFAQLYNKLQLCGSKGKKTLFYTVRKDADRSTILSGYGFYSLLIHD